MVSTTTISTEPKNVARASARDLTISTKQSIEVGNALRYRTISYAKKYLEQVITLRQAVPFHRFNRDMGHKAGMYSGRFPINTAKEFLKLVKSVEANAQFKGMNTSDLKIIKLIANKASIPFSGGRQRRATRRTHLEIEVKEITKKSSKGASTSTPKASKTKVKQTA